METSKMGEWELVDDIGVLTLNNPPQNYLAEPEFVDLSDLKRWTSNEMLRGIIIKGKGRHFCAGGDRENIFGAQGAEALRNSVRKGKELFNYIWDLPIPTVAAIKGACLGGGLEVALSCHIRVCSDKSVLSFPETGLGIMPGLHGTVKLPGIVGMANAIEIILTGKTINPEEALKLKLVDYVVPAKEVFDFSLDLLKRLAGDKPMSVIYAVVKSFINARKLTEDEAIEKGNTMFCELLGGLAGRLETLKHKDIDTHQ
jgi:enoyl-CoA hydratase/carnithine racemase